MSNRNSNLTRNLTRTFPEPNPNTMDYLKLHEHIAKRYDIYFFEGEIKEIVDIVSEMHNEKTKICTMDTNYKVETCINGWQRVTIDFTVKSRPRWWQFWKPRIDAQDFQYSLWLKPKDELFLYEPQIEEE